MRRHHEGKQQHPREGEFEMSTARRLRALLNGVRGTDRVTPMASITYRKVDVPE
jgi:hypothetical protein